MALGATAGNDSGKYSASLRRATSGSVAPEVTGPAQPPGPMVTKKTWPRGVTHNP
jgi:hypothetical protein